MARKPKTNYSEPYSGPDTRSDAPATIFTINSYVEAQALVSSILADIKQGFKLEITIQRRGYQ